MSNGSWTWSPEPGDGSGAPRHSAPPATPGAAPGYQPPVAPDESAFAAQFTVAMPGVRPGVQTWPLDYAQPPRRRRTGLWVGVGIGAVALVGVGVASWLLVGQKLVAPASPTQAVDRFVDGLEHKDGLAMLGTLSPAEVQPFRQMASEMSHDASAASATADPAATQELMEAIASLDISTQGLQLQEEALDDGLTKVSITAGTLTLDGDPQQIADAVVAAMGQRETLPPEDAEQMRQALAGSIDLPYTVDFGDEQEWGDRPFYLVTVHEGRGWYVSPLMTLGDYMLVGTGVQRGAMPRDADVAHPASPQEAAQQLAAAIPSLAKGDTHDLVSVLPEAERRFVAVYLQPLLDRMPASADPVSLTLTASDFDVTDQTGDRASVVPTNLAYRADAVDGGATFSFDGDCLATAVDGASGTSRSCISDVPLLAELGVDHPALVAVHEDGAWYVSAIGTAAELSRTVGDNLQRLQAEGKLDDPEWLQQQLPGLVGLLGGVYDAGPTEESLGADLGSDLGSDLLSDLGSDVGTGA